MCGANVLMCDGSVKFLKDSTNMMTFWGKRYPRQRRAFPDASSY